MVDRMTCLYTGTLKGRQLHCTGFTATIKALLSQGDLPRQGRVVGLTALLGIQSGGTPLVVSLEAADVGKLDDLPA